MDVNDYRKAYEAELASHAAVERRAPLPRVGIGDGTDLRLEEMQRVPLARSDLDGSIPALLATLASAREPIPVRKAALQAIRASTFLGEHFAPFRLDFLKTLRQLARPDTDPQLREDALEVLAVEKDPTAQDLLRQGLQDPKVALVPPAKALQLLGYDDHANIADLALEIFNKTADLGTKEAALRVLATNAKSQDLFARLLQDKSQPLSLRALSATGLHFLNPQKFASIARGIVMDDSDFEDIRATTLGALANAPEHTGLRGDPDFLDRVRQLGAQGSLANLRAAAMRLMAKP